MADVAAPARQPRQPIPLLILTGYLGAGKTTLLNRLLKTPEFTGSAVIVNEFGEIGLDHLLVERGEGDIFELSSGCLCCTVRGEFTAALERFLRDIDSGRIAPIARMIVETTGLADPLPVLESVLRHPYLPLRYRIEGVAMVADAVHGPAVIEREKEARQQAAIADLFLVSKIDIAADNGDAVRERVLALNPTAAIVDARATPAQILGALTGGARSSAMAADHIEDDHHNHDHHDPGVSSIALTTERTVERVMLDRFLGFLADRHGRDLLRAKGLVRLAEHPERPLVVQAVQGVFAPPVELAKWPGEDQLTRLVLIGRNLDRGFVRLAFAALEGKGGGPDASAVFDNPLAIPGVRGR